MRKGDERFVTREELDNAMQADPTPPAADCDYEKAQLLTTNWKLFYEDGNQIAVAVADLQLVARCFVEANKALERTRAALRKLTFLARTSGGWKKDDELCQVCETAENLLLERTDMDKRAERPADRAKAVLADWLSDTAIVGRRADAIASEAIEALAAAGLEVRVARPRRLARQQGTSNTADKENT